MAVTWDTIVDVDFGPGGNHDQYKCHGWSEPGWTEGARASIELGLLPGHREYFVCIEATPYRHQTFATYANSQLLGNHLAHWAFRIVFPVPGETVMAGQNLRIDFQLTCPKRPCDHGDSSDEHWRGLQVTRLSILGLNYDTIDQWLNRGLQHESDLSDRALLSCFESLGDNCEFGFVQKRNGALNSSFLKFSATTLESLMFGLNGGFIVLANKNNIDNDITVSTKDDEYIVNLNSSTIHYHTLIKTDDCDSLAVLQAESSKLTLKLRKFIAGLRAGNRIFVVKRNFDLQPGDVWALWVALQAYGNNTLLWVKSSEQSDVINTVDVVRPGLLSGTIADLALYDSATEADDLGWISICREAYRLWTGIHAEGRDFYAQNVLDG